jgi:hypothetical protein
MTGPPRNEVDIMAIAGSPEEIARWIFVRTAAGIAVVVAASIAVLYMAT